MHIVKYYSEHFACTEIVATEHNSYLVYSIFVVEHFLNFYANFSIPYLVYAIVFLTEMFFVGGNRTTKAFEANAYAQSNSYQINYTDFKY